MFTAVLVLTLRDSNPVTWIVAALKYINISIFAPVAPLRYCSFWLLGMGGFCNWI